MRASIDSLLRLPNPPSDEAPGPFTLDNLHVVRRGEQNEPDSVQRLRLTILRRYLTSGILSRPGPATVSPATLAGEMDFPSPREMFEELYGLSVAGTLTLADSLLRRTDSLARLLPVEQVPPTPRAIDRYFPPVRFLDLPRGAFRLTAGDSTRPAFVPPPMSGGGVEATDEFYRAVGIAFCNWNNTDQALEFSRLGGQSLSAASRHLIGGLPSNPAWMRQNLGMPVSDLKTYARLCAIRRLSTARRLASEVRSRCSGLLRDDPDLRTMQGNAAGVFSLLVDFRALLLAAEWESWLRTRYGVNWYENPEADQALRNLWSQGGRLNWEGILRKIGATEIEPDALIRSINELLLLSSR
jgi:hypothetical protein